MLLHHYRGPFFIDMSENDYEAIVSGKISAHDYILSANWLVGYFWGGGSMVGGGYYQPIDIVGRKEEVRRYLQILSCRGYRQSCGYMPTAEKCAGCKVDNCPFSKFKAGKWESELPEPDPRIKLFKGLFQRFEQAYPGFTLRGFLCSSAIPDDEIWVSANGRYDESQPFAFTATASDKVIRSLLMHEIVPEDWSEYAKGFKFLIKEFSDTEAHEATMEAIEKAYEGKDFTQKTEVIEVEEEPTATGLRGFLKRIFKAS